MDFVHGLKTIDALRKQAKAASERLNPYQPTNQTTKRAQSPFKRKFQKNLGGAPADSARGAGGERAPLRAAAVRLFCGHGCLIAFQVLDGQGFFPFQGDTVKTPYHRLSF
jgi:hypothetical protein